MPTPEDNAGEPAPVQLPGGWFEQNAPSSNTGFSGYAPGGIPMPSGGFQQTMPVSMTGGAQGGAGASLGPPSTWTPESLQSYFASRGVTPAPTSIDYWMGKRGELEARGQQLGDPNYGQTFLSHADEFGGGGYSGHDFGAGGGGGPFAGGIQNSPFAPGGSYSQSILANIANDPSYAFIRDEANKGAERSAAARGTLLTGGFQKGLAKLNANLASTEYGNAFNRGMGLAQLGSNEYGNLFGRNLQLAQLGLQGVGGYSNAAQNYGNAAGGYVTGAGNAGAAGTIGSSNAWTGTLGNIGNTAATVGILNQMNRNNPYGGVPYSGVTPQQSTWWGAGNQGPVV